MRDENFVTQCANTDCILEEKAIEGTGDTSAKSIEQFIGLALRIEAQAERAKARTV